MAEESRERRRDDTVARIVAAARQCFAKRGVDRTRMEHVAAAAGMTRQNVYRYASGRDELLELAIVECIREFALVLRDNVDPDVSDVREGFIDQLSAAVSMGRDSPEFVALTDALPRLRLNLLVGGPEVHPIVRYSFGPLLKRARLADMLRTDVSEDEIIEWLQGVLTFLAPRPDLVGERLRRMIDKFVASSVLITAIDKYR
jgi:AcrR family transcriptional regulator